MALIGGGGSGNVAGGNPSGVGSTLNYIGEHAYMYTGSIVNGTNETTIAETSTGNSYLVGQWQVQLFEVTTDDQAFTLYMNDEAIATTNLTSSKDYAPFEGIEIIIPPYTRLKITSQSLSASAKNVGSIITGRVYG